MSGGDDTTLDLASARHDLYGVLPANFVATRGELAKRAQAAGDRDLVRDIKALRKPTLAAWLVNTLARERPDELGELIELGRDLREGMGGVDADGLRELTRRRHHLVAGLVRQARELGAASEQRVGDDAARGVQATLEATLSDGDAADLVVDGCLAEPLEVSGFGFGFDLQPAGDAPDRDTGATVTNLGDRRARKEADLAEAEQGLADAQLLVGQAESAYEDAQRQASAAAKQVDKVSDRIDKLEVKLSEARAELAEQHHASRAAATAETDAERAMQAAARSLAAANERLRRLRR
jgi:hypothetical protein